MSDQPKNNMTALEIIALLDAAAQLSNLALGWINRGKVRGEWTIAEQQEFDNRLAAIGIRPEWRIER